MWWFGFVCVCVFEMRTVIADFAMANWDGRCALVAVELSW